MNKETNIQVTTDSTQIREPGPFVEIYQKYEIQRRGCRVAINDPVTPDTVIGRHYQTGLPIKNTSYGRVATIFYNPMHDSLMIMILAPSQ